MMMIKSILIKHTFIFTTFIAVAASEHLFESMLQRRAKPIRWKWSNDLDNLIKPLDVQRHRRFLREDGMGKWWRTMAPPIDDVRPPDAIGEKQQETYFIPPVASPKVQRLAETSIKENENVMVVNSTRTFREETSFRDRQQFDDFETLSLPVEPFGKDDDVVVASHYLTPTEKSYFDGQNYPSAFDGQNHPSAFDGQNHPSAFDGQNYPAPVPAEPQREVEDEGERHYYHTKYEDDSPQQSPFADVDGELLKEVIIHERHKPSKYEIQAVKSQRLRDLEKNYGGENGKSKASSSVEYVVPRAEYVVPLVEYADNGTEEDQIAGILPIVDYVTPAVEFVEPDIEYSPPPEEEEGRNVTRSARESLQEEEREDPWIGEAPSPPLEELSPTVGEDPKFTLEEESREDNQGGLEDEGGRRLRIVGLRREQIRIRRNHGDGKRVVFNEHYPTLEALPVVQFYCGDYMPGYYVDITTRCQVFHICDENGQRNSFLCPVGTVFNQEYLVCDWWYNVDCESSSKFYNSEYLQAYGSTNERQKTSMQADLTNKESEDAERVSIARVHTTPKPSASKSPYPQDADKTRRTTQILLSRVPKTQKAVHYPVGYAILLREYMKSTMTRDNEKKDDPLYYWNDKLDGDPRDAKFIPVKYPVVERYETETEKFPPEKNLRNISDYHKNTPRYTGGSRPYSILKSSHQQSRNSEHDRKTEYPNPIRSRESENRNANYNRESGDKNANRNRELENRNVNYNRESENRNVNYNKESENRILTHNRKPESARTYKPQGLSSYVPLPNIQKPKNNLGVSSREKTFSLEMEKKSSAVTKEKPKNFLDPRNKAKNSNLRKVLENIPTDSKNLFKSSKDHHRYHFIINPKEAIIPVSILEHVKSNITAIKYRHAESAFKHIPPQGNKAKAKSRKAPKKEIRSHVEYSQPAGYLRDHLALNSDPDVSKILNPIQNSRLRYGDRLSAKTRLASSSSFNEHVNKLTAEISRNNSAPLEISTSLPYYKNINQLKNSISRNNQSHESELQQSESRFNLAKFNRSSGGISVNDWKENYKLKNSTKYYYVPQDKEIEHSNMNKQQITISVRIERKAVMKAEDSIPLDKNVSSVTPTDRSVKNSVIIPNSQFSISHNHPTNSTNNTHNVDQIVNLHNIVAELNSQNEKRLNNGDQAITELSKTSSTSKKLDTVYNNDTITIANTTYRRQQLNQSMHYHTD